MRKLEVPLGTRFGFLIVQGEGPPRRGRRTLVCNCECGSQNVVVLLECVRDGRTTSCGCYRRKQTALTNAREKRRHGYRSHELYSTWNAMMHRCYDPSLPHFGNYGGRGIKVHLSWHEVQVFIPELEAEIGSRPEGMTLDRIDNDGDYCPGNVRWSTAVQQSRNQRARKAEPSVLRPDLAPYMRWPSSEIFQDLKGLLS